MKHRHLNHNKLTLAAIDDIISRGGMMDWYPLIKEIKADPFGDISKKTLIICENNPVYGSTKYFQYMINDERRLSTEIIIDDEIAKQTSVKLKV